MRPEGRDAASLWDIADSARRILSSVEGVRYEHWLTNQNLRELVSYRLAVIGEASKRISESMKERHPEIPWRKMVNQRNILIHAYDDIDYDLVWNVVQNELKTLLAKIEELLPPTSSMPGAD